MKVYSIKTRLTAIYTAIITFIILLISVSIELLSSNAMAEKSILSANRELRLLNEKLSLFAENVETESLFLLQMQNNEFFQDSTQFFSYTSGILSFLQDYVFTQPAIESITFYDNQGNVMLSDSKSNIVAAPAPAPSYIEDFKSINQNIEWVDFHYFQSPVASRSPIWGCSFLRKVYSYEGDFLGIFELNISETSLQSLYDITIADNYVFYILNEKQQIVSAKDKAQLHKTLRDLESEYPPVNNNSLIHLPSEYLYSEYTNETLNWTFVSTLPMSVIVKETLPLLISIFFVGFLAILFAFILLNSITAFITRPIISLTTAVDKIAEGDYTIKADTKTPNEIGQLAKQINIMAENTLNLLAEIEKESNLKRQFELSYIQLQMTPHFLYNTLESICGMISVDEKKKAIQTIQTLSLFYRNILTSGPPVVTLEKDLEITRCYLNILQQRYHEIYTYEIIVEPKAKAYCFPKLTLQPFVENALIHGILPAGYEGHLIISAKYEYDKLVISIADNGIGMDSNELEALRSAINKTDFLFDHTDATSFGIVKTLQRLSLFLNEPNISISIDSVRNHGTNVRLILPAEQKMKKEKNGDV